MGFAEIVFRSFYGKVATSLADVKEVVQNSPKKHAIGKDLANPRIYESVRVTLARNFRSARKIREQTGELIY